MTPKRKGPGLRSRPFLCPSALNLVSRRARGQQNGLRSLCSRSFDQHRRADNVVCQALVGFGVERETLPVYLNEEWVVEQLHEPDDAGHEGRDYEIGEKDVFTGAVPGSPR